MLKYVSKPEYVRICNHSSENSDGPEKYFYRRIVRIPSLNANIYIHINPHPT